MLDRDSAQPIGMFDSGFGGLTVARAVIDLLPAEDLIYIGDTGRFPYGPKPQSEVRAYAHELAWSLVKDFGAKVIVVACNTASAAALDDLRADLPVPVMDVVEPGAALPDGPYACVPNLPRNTPPRRALALPEIRAICFASTAFDAISLRS